MCGIIGYCGNEGAVGRVIYGLERLEYRGYDSAGTAFFENGEIRQIKAAGRLENLREKLQNDGSPESATAIGHTRWATHGRATEQNAHPHSSEHGSFSVIHNGIIENYAELKKELCTKGIEFKSDTDTEVIAQLLEFYYEESPLKTMQRVLPMLNGSFALGILHSAAPESVYCACRFSPLLVGISQDGCYIASDVSALPEKADEIYRMGDDEYGEISVNGAEFYSLDGKSVKKERVNMQSNEDISDKEGFEHYMLKEIYEQPESLRRTIASCLKDGLPDFTEQLEKSCGKHCRCGDGSKEANDNGECNGKKEKNKCKSCGANSGDCSCGKGRDNGVTYKTECAEKAISRIYITACGSAYHVGIAAQYVIEELCSIPVKAVTASEFRYSKPLLDAETLVILISQSGETADTLAALRKSVNSGARVISVINVGGSTMDRESPAVIMTRAGRETAVATTKAYTAQLAVMYLFAVFLAQKMGTLEGEDAQYLTREICSLPDEVQNIISRENRISELAWRCRDAEHAYFIGRGVDFAAAAEGALKLKEISYLHAESYPAGELKHGTISLIENGTPVVAMCASPPLFKKTRSNIEEVAARGARVICVTSESLKKEAAGESVFAVKDCHRLFTTLPEVIFSQIFAYHVAKLKKCDIDKPKNLAKSVTVE